MLSHPCSTKEQDVQEEEDVEEQDDQDGEDAEDGEEEDDGSTHATVVEAPGRTRGPREGRN